MEVYDHVGKIIGISKQAYIIHKYEDFLYF
jgi:hypothetical protein